MTLCLVGVRHKTHSQALTIEAEDALIAALNTQIPRQQLRMFVNPIDVGTTVIRMKDCRIRNEIS